MLALALIAWALLRLRSTLRRRNERRSDSAHTVGNDNGADPRLTKGRARPPCSLGDCLHPEDRGNRERGGHCASGGRPLAFKSRVLLVDGEGSRIVLEASPDEAVNAALLARPRCSFFAPVPGGHVEFAAADPQKIEHEGKPAIQLKFPDVLADRQRREYDRKPISPQVPLVCHADDGGVLSFKGGLIDISIGGLGFLVYDPAITKPQNTETQKSHQTKTKLTHETPH
jgi:hypothetical protein